MPPLPASHADHDPLVIAAHAAGDATGPELDEALALVSACGECAALHHDLRAIAAAMSDLPAPLRTRGFRLTPEQAASLRPAGWRRLLAPFAGPRFAFAGPLGAGLATLGLAGLLVAGSFGVPLSAGAPTGGAAVASGADDATAVEMAPAIAPTVAQASAPTSASLAPIAPDGFEVPNIAAAGPGASPIASQGGDIAGEFGAVDPKTTVTGSRASDGLASPDAAARVATGGTPVSPSPLDDTAPSPFAPLAAALLVVGAVLGGLRLIARRAA